MPANARVTICYGPYESSGMVQYRTFRLQGLQAALMARGHHWVMEKTFERNVVELVVSGEVIFRCKIEELEFVSTEEAEPYVLRRKHGLKSLCQLPHVSW